MSTHWKGGEAQNKDVKVKCDAKRCLMKIQIDMRCIFESMLSNKYNDMLLLLLFQTFQFDFIFFPEGTFQKLPSGFFPLRGYPLFRNIS